VNQQGVHPSMHSNADITGLILAGGLGRRMSVDGQGTNKAMMTFKGRAMVATVIERLLPQVNSLILNVNGSTAEFDPLVPSNTVFVEDAVKGYAGPLAGLHAALKTCKTPWLQMVPCDSPFFPATLAKSLLKAATTSGALVAVAATTVQTHPVFLLVNASLLPSLESYLDAGERKIDRWYKQHAYVEHLFPDEDDFANINTENELKTLENRSL
jgi:molybdenum cofactor guanylyltransferase